jgi:chromosome segregation ATPase
LKANGKHGKPRTPDERRYVVQMALEDIELGEKTDVEIAAICDVSSMTVGRVRKALGLEKATRIDKNGRKVDVTKHGRPAATEPEPEYTHDDRLSELATEHQHALEENNKLRDRLAINALPDAEEAKAEIEETIDGLRSQVSSLELELRAVTQSRNDYQQKNSDLIKQVTYWKRRAEKAEKAAA